MDQTQKQQLRSIEGKIERLRQRTAALGYEHKELRPVLDLIKGILDLLGDEL